MSIVTSAGIQRNPLVPRFGIVAYQGRIGGPDIVDMPVPSLYQDFINEQSLAIGATTFTRASSGTYVNAAGLVATASTNVPRFEYSPITLAPLGLLIEESRTNLLLRSAEFDNGSWTKVNSSVTANAATAPDGTLSADKLVEDTNNAVHRTLQDVTATVAQTWSASVFVEPAGRTALYLIITDAAAGANYVRARFSLSGAGSVTVTEAGGNGSGAAASIVPVGSGRYRIRVTGQPNTSGTSVRVDVQLDNGSGTSYAGDGTSGVYLWGAQLEAGSFSTSYVATTSASATRAADVCSIGMLTPWFNAAEGTLLVEGDSFATDSNQRRIVSINDGTDSNYISVSRFGNTAQVRADVTVSGVNQFNTITTAWALDTAAKVALAYKANDFAAILGSGGVLGTLGTDTSGTIPTVDRFIIGNQITNRWCGHIRRISYWPTRLANAQLQGLVA